MRNHRMTGRTGLLVGLLWIGACGPASEPVGPAGDPLPSSPFLVSNPVRSSAAVEGQPGAGATSGGAGLAYVSLPSGSFPEGTSVGIRDGLTGADTEVPVVDGGFDPEPIAASPGDTLDFTVALGAGESPLRFAQIVPVESPPVVVRTDPKPGKRDVPLNAVIVIVFSEPVDSSTITSATIQLRLGSNVIPGTLQVTGADRLMVELRPGAPLASGAEYELVVGSGIADLDGEALLTPSSVKFMTSTGGTPPVAPTGRIAFVASGSDGVSHIYALDLATSATTQLTAAAEDDYWPAWSPDRTRIAFYRAGDDNARGLWIMNADGSGAVRRSTLAGAASWSPDGTRLAVMGNALWFVSASGAEADEHVLDALPGFVSYEHPAWSPNGSTIAFEGTVDWGGGDYFTHLYLMDADGSNVRRLTSPCCGIQYAEGSPAWSPTGKQLAFWSYGYGIARAGADGSGISSVTHDGMAQGGGGPATGFNAHPSWSADGEWLVFQSPWSSGQLVVRRADGSGSATVVTNMPGGASSPSW